MRGVSLPCIYFFVSGKQTNEGYEVEILRADKDYLDLFFHTIEK